MIHWIKPPNLPALAKYIECYWFIEKSADSTSYAYPKLNPDPTAHLIISPKDQAYHYASNSDVSTGIGNHWLFPHHQTLELDHSKPFAHLGVKFHIGALYSLGIPTYAHPILDSVQEVDVTGLWNSTEFNENTLFALARSDSSRCCELLDATLLPWLNEAKEDQHSQLTRKTLDLLDSNAISELSRLLFCSQRTLERSFNRVTGFTLKQCHSMNKLEAMLEYLYQRDTNNIDWVDVAFKFGFSDQPHLIRQLKKQIGLTPQAYAKERGLAIDVYGGVNLD